MTKYAIQVYVDGWVYVMNSDASEILTFEDKNEAESIANDWRLPKMPDAVRVVELS